MKYDYHGSEDTGLRIDNPLYPKIHSPQEMYEALSEIWCEYTCAPRMRKDWSKENRTLGQCSVTAFLVQDVFGGEVYGIPLKEGGYHSFNVADGHLFDLTSAQFKEKLDYNDCVLQKREVHFAKQEKYERYLYLKKEFEMKMADE
ncbi:MAG: hypothetical protein E7194_04875 [Erysipelotrichaceae bacterium]|nr:hypothetical protein [Erysipelotrichaceae bacterium]